MLDAANFSVPQHRKRIYIVGFSKKIAEHKNFSFNWPLKHKEPVGIGQFIESHEDDYSITKYYQQSYLFKKNDGRPQVIDKNSEIQVKTLVATYYKVQRLTGTFVKDGKTGLRLLSHNECKAIMGFPKGFKFPVSRTQMYRQMGNSVAIPVVQEIAKAMMEVLNTCVKNKTKPSKKETLPKKSVIVVA